MQFHAKIAYYVVLGHIGHSAPFYVGFPAFLQYDGSP